MEFLRELISTYIISILGLIGLITNIYLIYIFNTKTICDKTCEIISSNYAYIFNKFNFIKEDSIFNINDLYYGLLFYLFIIFLSKETKFLKILILFGIVFSLIKLFAMFFILKKVCNYCMIIHIINFLLFFFIFNR